MIGFKMFLINYCVTYEVKVDKIKHSTIQVFVELNFLRTSGVQIASLLDS